MDPALKKATGHRLCLIGPLVDKYLERIGKIMYRRLARKHVTGEVQPVNEYIPVEIFNHMLSLFGGYGCSLNTTYFKTKKKQTNVLKKQYIWIESDSSANKLFAPWRFDGTNYLAKRHFIKKLVPGTKKQKYECDGYAKVAVCEETPIRLVYEYKTNILSVCFIIQRYTADGFAIDSSVQAQMNK